MVQNQNTSEYPFFTDGSASVPSMHGGRRQNVFLNVERRGDLSTASRRPTNTMMTRRAAQQAEPLVLHMFLNGFFEVPKSETVNEIKDVVFYWIQLPLVFFDSPRLIIDLNWLFDARFVAKAACPAVWMSSWRTCHGWHS